MQSKGEIDDMLIGPDYSHWNVDADYGLGDFQIHKLTQGLSYLDPTAEQWFDRRTYGLNGVYHFMTTDNIHLQAEHFTDKLRKLDMLERVMPIVDYEGDIAFKDKDGSILKQLINEISMIIDWQPVIYMDKTNANKLMSGNHSNWFRNMCSLWLADYSTKGIEIKPYKQWIPVLRQFTNKPLCDLNIFYGNENGWKSFLIQQS